MTVLHQRLCRAHFLALRSLHNTIVEFNFKYTAAGRVHLRDIRGVGGRVRREDTVVNRGFEREWVPVLSKLDILWRSRIGDVQ